MTDHNIDVAAAIDPANVEQIAAQLGLQLRWNDRVPFVRVEVRTDHRVAWLLMHHHHIEHTDDVAELLRDVRRQLWSAL